MTPSMRAAVDAVREGKAILLLDAQDRENEGDLVIAGEKIDTESMNFLIQHGSGIVCLALTQERLDQLSLGPMAPQNTNLFNTAFSVSIEARVGISTGVSAKDRATTIKTALSDETRPSDLARPGHVFPVACVDQGVFKRMGHTEGSVDLMKIANLKPSAVLCDVMNSDGSMVLGHERENFARRHGLDVLFVEEILFHRIKTEPIFEHSEKSLLNTRFGEIIWHRFCFWGEESIDIFLRFKSLESKPHRIKIIANENPHQRYLAAILSSAEDDPLKHALKSLENQDCDLVGLLAQPNSKLKAALCRALLVLNIKNICAPEDFSIIASDYFGISCVR